MMKNIDFSIYMIYFNRLRRTIMHKIIDRNLTLEFELDELAKDFGYNLWKTVN